MLSTSYKWCKNIIRAHSKKKGKDIVDSPSSGIMSPRRCTFRCQHTMRRHLSAFSILRLSYRRISCISTSKSCMVQKPNLQTHLTPPHPSIKQERNSSKKSWGYSSILRKPLTQRCSPHSAQLRPNRQHPQKGRCKNAYNS
jgi:hypothetical protein